MTDLGLITTHGTNIGDDLIRVGARAVIDAALGEPPQSVVEVNKHRPLTVLRSPWPDRIVQRLPRGRHTATRHIGRALAPLRLASVFDDVAIVAQCGMPLMWPGCGRAEWYPTVWRDVLGRRHVPLVLNLAGGSCFPWTAQRRPRLERGDAAALRMILGRSDLITVRDELAAEVAARLGFAATALPCTAMHAARATGIAGADGDAVVLNIMPRGAHFTWGQELDAATWLATVDRLVSLLAPDFPLLFLCHDRAEHDLARLRWPGHEAVLPTRPFDYLVAARRARVAVVNRMHAAVALAGLGVPAVAVGSDTRLLMVEQTGQVVQYLGEATATGLRDRVHELVAEAGKRREYLRDLEERSFATHSDLVRTSHVDWLDRSP